MEPIKIKKKPSHVLKIEGKKNLPPPQDFQQWSNALKKLSWEPYFHGGIVAIITSFLLASFLFPALPDWTQLNLVLNLFIHWISALCLGLSSTFVFCRASNRYHHTAVLWGGILGFLGIFFGYFMRAHQNNLSFFVLFQGQLLPFVISFFSCFLGALIVVQQSAVPDLSFKDEIEALPEPSFSPRLKLAPKTKKRHRKFRANLETRTKIDPHAISHLCPVCVDESILILHATLNVVECQVCGAKHHKACWESNGGCGTLSEH